MTISKQNMNEIYASYLKWLADSKAAEIAILTSCPEVQATLEPSVPMSKKEFERMLGEKSPTSRVQFIERLAAGFECAADDFATKIARASKAHGRGLGR